MPYKTTIVIRGEAVEELEAIEFQTETDLIIEALEEVNRQIHGIIPKRLIETILIQKVE